MNNVEITEDNYERIFCISDIHGCLEQFIKALSKIKLDKKKDLLLIAGDSCDRGDDSLGVYSYILELINKGFNIIHLLGNHEKMFFDYFVYEEGAELWKKNGGEKTINNYCSDGDLLQEHLDYIENMPYYIESDNYIVVHAGINPKNAMEAQTENEILWITDEFKNKKISKITKCIVFGHSITKSGKIEFNSNNSIGIDCGCYKNGKLGVLELKTRTEFYVK